MLVKHARLPQSPFPLPSSQLSSVWNQLRCSQKEFIMYIQENAFTGNSNNQISKNLFAYFYLGCQSLVYTRLASNSRFSWGWLWTPKPLPKLPMCKIIDVLLHPIYGGTGNPAQDFMHSRKTFYQQSSIGISLAFFIFGKFLVCSLGRPWFFYLSFLSAGIRGVHYHTWHNILRVQM